MAKEFSLVLVVMVASCSVMEVSFDVIAAMAVSRVVVEWDERYRASLVVMTGVVSSCKLVALEELLLELLYC